MNYYHHYGHSKIAVKKKQKQKNHRSLLVTTVKPDRSSYFNKLPHYFTLETKTKAWVKSCFSSNQELPQSITIFPNECQFQPASQQRHHERTLKC